MKTFVLGVLLMLTPFTSQAQRLYDPLGKNADSVRSKNILFVLERIEIDQLELTKLLFGDNILKSGNQLRKEVDALLKNKKALNSQG